MLNCLENNFLHDRCCLYDRSERKCYKICPSTARYFFFCSLQSARYHLKSKSNASHCIQYSKSFFSVYLDRFQKTKKKSRAMWKQQYWVYIYVMCMCVCACAVHVLDVMYIWISLWWFWYRCPLHRMSISLDFTRIT